MRVNVLSYEPAGGWILYDYAAKLAEHLKPHVSHVALTHAQAPGYDVTLHVNYARLHEIKAHGLHATVVTHIDAPRKFNLVNAQAQGGIWGMCMSEETTRRLNEFTGTSMFVNFAPPAMLAAPRKQLTVMVSGRIYPDGRKNESWALDFFRSFRPGDLRIRTMGVGWDALLADLQAQGHQIEHRSDFDRTVYVQWLQDSDHLLNTGFDEGALSTLDALLYGVVPIVSAQGYHLEQGGPMLSFATRDQLMAIASGLRGELDEANALRQRMTDWDGFARRHAEFWRSKLQAKVDSRHALLAA